MVGRGILPAKLDYKLKTERSCSYRRYRTLEPMRQVCMEIQKVHRGEWWHLWRSSFCFPLSFLLFLFSFFLPVFILIWNYRQKK